MCVKTNTRLELWNKKGFIKLLQSPEQLEEHNLIEFTFIYITYNRYKKNEFPCQSFHQITQVNPYLACLSSLIYLYWLPIYSRINFKIAHITQKAVHLDHPPSLCQHVTFQTSSTRIRPKIPSNFNAPLLKVLPARLLPTELPPSLFCEVKRLKNLSYSFISTLTRD